MLRPSAIIAWIALTPSAVAGILTIRFGRRICSCRCRAAVLGARTVVGQVGSDLDAGEAVGAVTVVVQLGEHVESAVDVGQHHCPVVVDRSAAPTVASLRELLVVVGRALDGLLEDGRVAGEAADALVDEVAELTGRDVAALQVVEPRALPELVVQVGETIHDYPFA